MARAGSLGERTRLAVEVGNQAEAGQLADSRQVAFP